MLALDEVCFTVYVYAVYYYINSKVPLEVPAYQYLIKFGKQTNIEPFKSSRSGNFIEYV